MLALPLALSRNTLALFAYIGGFSAATGMVIVASVALATMVSNDLVMPLLLRRGWAERASEADVATQVLWVRRVAILLLALCAYAYYRSAASDDRHAGRVRPDRVRRGRAVRAGPDRRPVLARRQPPRACEIGMLVGFATWIYTLLLPTLSRVGLAGTGLAARPVRSASTGCGRSSCSA